MKELKIPNAPRPTMVRFVYSTLFMTENSLVVAVGHTVAQEMMAGPMVMMEADLRETRMLGTSWALWRVYGLMKEE